MTEKLTWFTNIPKHEIDDFFKSPNHKNMIVGLPKESGCYSSLQLEGHNIVGIYIKEEIT